MISPSYLLAAYQTGLFPMSVDGQIKWFSPERRGIVPIDRFHVPRRLRRLLRQGRYDVSINRSFNDVIVACASRPDSTGNWIDEEIIESYSTLHEAGFAHSVEAWLNGTLVGGLYGVSIGGAFFGESMFYRENDASKVALCGLVDRLRDRGYSLLDIQWLTAHLKRLGGQEVSRRQYLGILTRVLREKRKFD